MSQQNPLELAKQGNPSAIAALINRNLKPKGVTAKVSRKDGCLRVMLEANEVPNQDSLVELIRSGVLKLNVSGINTLQIFGRQADDEVPVWSQIINLKAPQPYPISQKQTSESKELESSSTKNSAIPHSTKSSSTKINSSKSTFKADSGRPRYSSKTSSKQSQLGPRSDQSPKKTDDLLSLLNSSSENNPLVQWIGIIFFLLFALIMWGTLGKGSDPSPRTQSPSEITSEEARRTQIEEHFSSWDGSHNELTKIIKESMNDPRSYEHIETRYSDRGDYLIVVTEFRGKNAFGGIVKNSVTAKVDLSGNVLEIVSQSP